MTERGKAESAKRSFASKNFEFCFLSRSFSLKNGKKAILLNKILDMVLATDMVFHNEHLIYFSDAKNSPSLADTTTVLGFMLHSADISHSLRPWKHHERMVRQGGGRKRVCWAIGRRSAAIGHS